MAIEAISELKTLQDIAKDHALDPIQVSQWKKQLLEGPGNFFSMGRGAREKKSIR